MTDRNPESFDRTRQLAMTRGAQLNDHPLGRLAPVRVVDEPTGRPGDIDEELARRLWASGTLDYADEMVATPVEDPRTGVTALVEVDQLGGGWFQVRAPWLDEAVKVQGAEAAEDERLAQIEAGLGKIDLRRPPEQAQFTISEVGSNGWFEVSGPGLAEPLKIRGEQAAMAKRDELARSGPLEAGGVVEPPAPPPAPGPDVTGAGAGAGGGEDDED